MQLYRVLHLHLVRVLEKTQRLYPDHRLPNQPHVLTHKRVTDHLYLQLVPYTVQIKTETILQLLIVLDDLLLETLFFENYFLPLFGILDPVGVDTSFVNSKRFFPLIIDVKDNARIHQTNTRCIVDDVGLKGSELKFSFKIK